MNVFSLEPVDSVAITRVALPGREAVELPSTSRQALQGADFEIAEQREPSFILDGSLLVTGEVDRTTEFEQGFPFHEAYRQARWQPDRQALEEFSIDHLVPSHCTGWRATHAIAARFPEAFRPAGRAPPLGGRPGFESGNRGTP
jgi:hypothetical protein